VITRQQIRAVMADGARVVDSAGHSVGRIVDVVLDVQTTEPAYMTVSCGPHPGVAVVVPLTGARLLDGSVQVPYTAAGVSGAPPADGSAGRLDRQQEEELRRYYAGLDDGVPVEPYRLAGRGRGADPEPRAGWPRTPVVDGNGHRTTDVTAAGSLLVPAGVEVLPLVAGLDVRTGDDGPAAYPATASGPWPPVSTSSPGPPWWHRRQWRWPSIPTSVRAMRLEVCAMLDMTGLPDDEIEDLILAAGEAGANAVEHARLSTLPFFDVLTEVGEHWARIVVQDHGRWRTPTAGGHRGRGLRMIGLLADATLTVGARGTTVVLRNRPGSSD
jgi:anti-sigma regulatory factor (Ser/Thr protein kinase)/sporulation protein YlmC with PRC-barrel domain